MILMCQFATIILLTFLLSCEMHSVTSSTSAFFCTLSSSLPCCNFIDEENIDWFRWLKSGRARNYPKKSNAKDESVYY